MKHKTSELTGALLDAAVAKAEGRVKFITHAPDGMVLLPRNGRASLADPKDWDAYTPSTYWQDGGPIIEREGIKLMPPQGDRSRWLAEVFQGKPHFGWAEASSPLIAAMRAYVASKLGEEVEL